MASERSKRRDLLACIFITKSISKKLLIKVYDYAGKAYFSKGCWNPERKLGVTTHFSEIITRDARRADRV